jgi:hypothetical protein
MSLCGCCWLLALPPSKASIAPAIQVTALLVGVKIAFKAVTNIDDGLIAGRQSRITSGQ